MFRLSTKQLFLTYPRCNISKEDAYHLLLEKFIVELICVASERHADGSPHLHVYIKLKGTLDTRDPNFADIQGFHGNYQGCRSAKAVLKYCTKKEDFKANWDVMASIECKKNKRADIGKLLLNGKSLLELLPEYPELVFNYKRIKEDLREINLDRGFQVEKMPLWLPNPWGLVLRTSGSKRRHFWIYSNSPNKGKTTKFAFPLREEFGFSIITGDFSYWNIRGDEQGLVLDDYNTARLKYDFLNVMCDGTAGYRVFNRGVVTLNSPCIIVLSNRSIKDLYPNMYFLLEARFKEYALP